MGDSHIGANAPNNDSTQEKQAIEVNLNIGLFFDGTNNNKVQSMIALNSRRINFFKKYGDQFKKYFPQTKDYNTLSRSELENANIGTIDELDNVYGYSNKIDFSIEKNIASDNMSEYRYASSAEKYDGHGKKGIIGKILKFFVDDARREKLSRNAGNKADKTVLVNHLASVSPSQGSGYTNVAILNSLYETSETRKDSDSTSPLDLYYSIYIEGSGANEEISVIKQVVNMPSAIIGLGFGVDESGVVQKCRKAIQRVKDIYESFAVRSDVSNINCHFDVFGFSRGATTARCFTYILNPQKTNDYVDKKINKMVCGNESFLLDKKTNKLGTKNVRTLGLYDTVASIGILREGTAYVLGAKFLKMPDKDEFSQANSIFHDTNVDDFGLYSTDQADSVLQICALDEFRKNFALVDIESSIKSGNGCEVYIPGCHTDIGGGASWGLDAFKIINCDEIATRGSIIYNLYIRVNGIIELLNGVDGMIIAFASTAASISSTTSWPMAYKTIQSLIPSLHKAVSGWFSLVTGYESPSAYYAKNGIAYDKLEYVQPPQGFSIIADFNTATKTAIDTISSGQANLQNGIMLSRKVINADVGTKICSVGGLIDIGANIIKSLISCKNAILKIITDFENLRNQKGMGGEFRYIIETEIVKWQNQIVILEDAINIFNLVFDVKCEKFIIPVEQRRICFYTGDPFDKSVRTDRSKKDLIKPVTADVLKELGWIDSTVQKEEDTTWCTGRPTAENIDKARAEGRSILIEKTKVAHSFSRENIGICKYARPGYTLIALKAMYVWANSKSRMFKPFPNEAYNIPEDLNKFYKSVESTVQGKGRHICTPQDPIFDYKYIRQKYLHLSLNQQILSLADNGVVNGPSFMPVESGLSDDERKKLVAAKSVANEKESFNFDNIITRRIYQGIKNSPTAGGKEYVATPSLQFWYLG